MQRHWQKMPRYAYRCDACEILFERIHSMAEKLTDCENCNSEGSLKRIPSNFFYSDSVEPSSANSGRVGEIVKNHIEETKGAIEQEKREMMEEYEL